MLKIDRKKLAIATIITLFCSAHALAQGPADKLYDLTVGNTIAQVEIADTDASRRLGLMHRQQMAESQGMLFIFANNDRHCFWMKNTLIPLSIAFIDSNNTIIDIQDMQAHDLTPHCASKQVQQALEMNLGWFERNNISVGTQIKLK